MKNIISLTFIAFMAIYQVNAQNKSDKKSAVMKTNIPKISDFPTGEENTGFAQYFTGKSWLAPLTKDKNLNVPMANVTFEPGCRNNWHSHTGGQLLIVVGGEGLYQERGKQARHLKPGDIVEIAPNIEHWHGATATSWFSHLATNGNPSSNENNWFDPVTDEVYKEANKK
ncbi:cupin domain-containing protein [Flavobacterium sp. W1B]|uniref:cupin domain-containing protein n=1 Tax=Flavobacterium sp. W1B TaxID=3394146 RepID=UPI0039BC9BA1